MEITTDLLEECSEILIRIIKKKLPIWDEQIKLTFKSIEDYVNKKGSDDYW